ncbi:hypothetical protein [Acetobacter cibinongensis]|uniref:DUF551 domain-containing protein n=1 Tax=Acetobacter cibinongensis TaxID=146475 RepID=A0A1Z5YVY5_9PROT|nr:hypothetical protein [Acetobacter cibinongensis]OUJ03162.1 hypothetical protein HK14_03070 [Acetobacter cibinongensis]
MTDPRIEAAAKAICAEFMKDSKAVGAARLWTQDAFLDLARASLSAADAAAWRPIETAPRDGAHIDLWVINSDGEGHRLTDAYFGEIPHTCGEYGKYCDSCPPEGNFWIDGIFGQQIFGRIIGWQPLPAPPKDEVLG